MRRRMTVAITFAVLSMAHVPTVADASRGKPISIPVLVDITDYPHATDKLSDAIFFKVMNSKLITPNVDAPDAMIIKLLPPRSVPQKDRVDVLYTWGKRVLADVTFPCAPPQVASCSAAIVKTAERVSRTVRLSL
jgi:hypothetical protein